MATATLTTNDRAVFGALFDPEASLDRGIHIDDKVEDTYDKHTLRTIQETEREALGLIDSQFPVERDTRKAISELNSIIEEYPAYASAWNNRAQARRLLAPYEAPDYICDVFYDLGEAIKLASPLSPTKPVSTLNATVLASAHTHRGYLLWRASRSESFRSLMSQISQLRDLSSAQLEESASRDFALGGRYGNKTAQSLAVKTNPYAKLCGSIVKEALQKEIRDYATSTNSMS